MSFFSPCEGDGFFCGWLRKNAILYLSQLYAWRIQIQFMGYRTHPSQRDPRGRPTSLMSNG